MSSSSAKKSTIVRARKSVTLGSLRLGFGALERVAPALGARWAERLWLAVPARPWVPKNAAPVPTGEEFELAVGVSTVRGEVWGSGPVVYLVHGWGGTRGQLSAFVAPLIAAGYRVVAFDAPSHGRSTAGAAGPKHGLLPEFAAALSASVERFGAAHGVIAHSFGSTATGLAVLDGLPTAGLVFIAPLGDPNAYSYGFARMLGFGERIRTGFLALLEQRVGRRMPEFDITSRAALRDPATVPPLLVVHDTGDREIPAAGGRALAKAWPGAEFEETSGLGHYRILQDPAVVRMAVDFVAAAAFADRLADGRAAGA